MRRLTILLTLATAACGGGSRAPVEIRLEQQEQRVDVEVRVDGEREVIVDLGGVALVVEASVTGEVEPLWLRPRPVTTATLSFTIRGTGIAQVTVWARGVPAPAARRERSLVWTDPALVDDPESVGLARVLAAAADDGHGGVLLDRWFRRFATTAHSERAAPASFMDEVAAQQGADPAAWDLDALPFEVTGVHNRLDLAPREGGCGQLRVSFASTHPIYAPLHLIFLFRQLPREDDIAPDGSVHCLGTARRWARLAALDGEPWLVAARALLDENLTRDRFLLAESVELTVSPWEWRQWTPTPGAADSLDNPPLFQTVDTPALNAPGALRDDFLAWVAQNQAGLLAREVEIPARFRAPSARVTQGVPRAPLDVGDQALAAAIEIVGCPACHTTDAEFVQTTPQRTFSPFYDKELDARAARLDLMNAGDDVPVPPFGPLQAE